jgi:hypothetical protein
MALVTDKRVNVMDDRRVIRIGEQEEYEQLKRKAQSLKPKCLGMNNAI